MIHSDFTNQTGILWDINASGELPLILLGVVGSTYDSVPYDIGFDPCAPETRLRVIECRHHSWTSAYEKSVLGCFRGIPPYLTRI